MEQVLRQILEGRNLTAVQIFLYLQLLDLLTTLLGLRLGAAEASPFVRLLMQVGPAWGVFLSKAAAVALAALAIGLGRAHLIARINYWYAALVVWNLFVVLSLHSAG